MKKRIIAAVLAASMAFSMPIGAMAASKPDSVSTLAQMEETNATQQVQPLGIKEFHSHLEKRYEYGKTRFYVYYAAQVENPNPDYAIDFASLNVAIYGSDGSILKTDSGTLVTLPLIQKESRLLILNVLSVQKTGTATKLAQPIKLSVPENLP